MREWGTHLLIVRPAGHYGGLFAVWDGSASSRQRMLLVLTAACWRTELDPARTREGRLSRLASPPRSAKPRGHITEPWHSGGAGALAPATTVVLAVGGDIPYLYALTGYDCRVRLV